MITSNNISCGYGKTTILQDFTITFAQSKLTALIGENGCGKSTLLKAIMGFLSLTAGEVTILHNGNQVNLHQIPAKQRGKVGGVFATTYILP